MLMEAKALPITAAQDALASAQSEWGGSVDSGQRLMPIEQHLGTLVMDTEAVCLVEGSWRAVGFESRQEQLACEEIAAEGIPVYWPRLWERVPHGRGGTRVVQRSMFGPYGFIRCIDEDAIWARVATSRGVQNVLRSAGGRMKVIDDLVIHVIRLREFENFKEYDAMARQAAEDNARHLEEVARHQAAKNARELETFRREAAKKITWHFTPEDIVRIKNGPFAGFNAQLETAVDENGRIAALVDVFNRPTKANLSAFDIEAT